MIPPLAMNGATSIVAHLCLGRDFQVSLLVDWYFRATFSPFKGSFTSTAVCTKACQSTRGSTFMRNCGL